MAIEGYTEEEEFGTKLGTILSSSRPIHSIEYLKGRDEELTTIKRSLYAPGRHVFIFGDRGVGKSSLGQTAAVQYQSSDAEPIFVSGSPTDTFATIIGNIASAALQQPRTEAIKEIKNLAVEVGGIKVGEGQERSAIDIAASIRTVGDAVAVLKQVALAHSEKPVVVIDEFDTIPDAIQRNLFASLLKQMGDQSVPLKFIFTGIGKSLDELLGAHASAYRHLETVELPTLSWEARREIANSAVEAFGLELNDNVNWRIAMISDGFPYYVHLITERILWAAFSSDVIVTTIDPNLFAAGLTDAVAATTAELKRPYQQAVLNRHHEFEDIVFATADHDDLLRSLDDMYKSYQVIVEKRRDGRVTVDRNRFTSDVRKLKGTDYGAVLIDGGRRGWYSYREKMLRGYVRMQAQVSGIELTGERPTPKQTMHISNARGGYRGANLPAGVRQNTRIADLDKAD